MIYSAFLQHPDLNKTKQNKTKQKKIDIPTLPIFRPKAQTNLYFFFFLGLSYFPRGFIENNTVLSQSFSRKQYGTSLGLCLETILYFPAALMGQYNTFPGLFIWNNSANIVLSRSFC